MNSIYKTYLAAALLGFGVSACTGSSHHGHDHDDSEHSNEHSSEHSSEHATEHKADHSKFGHLSAIYLCGNEEVQTAHSNKETILAYKGNKINVSRKVSVVDGAFAGETFNGTFNGQTFIFKGKGYDASISVDGEVTSCEKISCIPLGGPH